MEWGINSLPLLFSLMINGCKLFRLFFRSVRLPREYRKRLDSFIEFRDWSIVQLRTPDHSSISSTVSGPIKNNYRRSFLGGELPAKKETMDTCDLGFGGNSWFYKNPCLLVTKILCKVWWKIYVPFEYSLDEMKTNSQIIFIEGWVKLVKYSLALFFPNRPYF